MSTNITKQKRDELVSKLNSIREFLTSSSDENATRLLGFLGELENDVTNKHYGLIFEEHRESIDEKLETALPVLAEDESLEIDRGGQQNFLIEGDNLASLKLLEKTHRGKIDVIYIDPPYNTGNKDFIYYDNFIDSTDTFRHSKWCSFMKKRLEIARKLLSEKGVIFISIDDNEQAALKLLCDEIFGEGNFVGQIIWQSATDNNPRQISTEHEYILCFAKNIVLQEKWLIKSKKAELIEEKYNELKRKSNDLNYIKTELKKWMKQNEENLKGVVHYNNVDEKGVYSSSQNSSNTKPGGYTFDIIHPVTKKPCVKPAFGWRWTETTFWNYANNGDVEWGADENTQPHIKKRIDTVEEQLKSIYYEDGRASTKILETIFNGERVFNNPKPINLISRLIEFSTSFASTPQASALAVPNPRGNSQLSTVNSQFSTILDFFAGSGTTGHAVLKLNAADNGNRRFILCTNNQNNICRDITYERLKRVIEKENYAASLKYFRVDFVDINDKLYYEYADELLAHTRELVELENAISFNKNPKIAICLTEEELDSFCSGKKKINAVKKIYLGHEVQTTGEQEDLFNSKQIEIVRIPNYYYSDVE